MASASGIQALVLTADASLVTSFANLSRELGIEARGSGDSQHISDQFNGEKYEALVLDFDTIPTAKSVLGLLRKAPRNKNTVVFAVATNLEHREEALREGAHFLLQRPIDASTMRETLHAAYDLMRVERRKYFRCVADLSVLLTLHQSKQTIQGSTMNVSTSGMAVSTANPLTLAETLDIALFLPNGFTMRATGIVIWDDKHGKSGLKFSCSGPEMRKELNAWLDSQFTAKAGEGALPESSQFQ
jgi:FixJ family two-component response regulator